MLKSNKELLAVFSDIKKNLGDVQIRYGRHLNSKITERLMRLQDALELVNYSFKMDKMWNNLEQNLTPPLKDLMNNLMHDQNMSSFDPLELTLSPAIKTLIQETYELWKLEIQFYLV